jgi:type IV secretion system protein TrbG
MILTGLMLAAAAPAIQPSNVTASTPQIAYSSIRAAAAAPPPPARVQAANRAALLEPQGDRFREAVQVFPWSEGGLYHLYTAPGQITDIALEPGEQLTAVAAGDTVRWILGDTTSGSGASRQVHILLKPSAPGLSTNLVITTDRRIYRLVAVSTARTAMAAVSWTYPAAALVALSGPEAENAAGDAGARTACRP